MTQKGASLAKRLHGNVVRALWAGLTGVLIFFAVVTLPYIRENEAAYRVSEATEISAENDVYCRGWNFQPGTSNYRSCLDDLTKLRASVLKRFSEEYQF
jgi:hypothetical protein